MEPQRPVASLLLQGLKVQGAIVEPDIESMARNFVPSLQNSNSCLYGVSSHQIRHEWYLHYDRAWTPVHAWSMTAALSITMTRSVH